MKQLLLFGLLCFGAICSYGQKTIHTDRLQYASPSSVGMDSSQLYQGIQAIAAEAIQAGAFPGMQVLVAKKGKVIFHQTYGHHTYDKRRVVQSDDLYDLASVTKVTTGLPVLMQLHGQGRFQLHAPLKEYLPYFKKSNKGTLTFKNMLAHQARLQPYIVYWQKTKKADGSFKKRSFQNTPSPRYPIRITDQLFLHRKYYKKMHRAIFESPLNKAKGYRYSGLLFQMMPQLVKSLTGQPFEQYLEEQFFQKLGTSTLTFNPIDKFPLSRIIPSERDTFFRKQLVHGRVHDEAAAMLGGVSGNAGLFGNAFDLAQLLQMYLNEGVYNNHRFIDSTSVQLFTSYQYPWNGNRRGLGFDKPLLEYDAVKSSVAKDASPASYGHSGFTGTMVWVDPTHELIFIFLSNRVYPDRSRRAIYQLNVRPRIHQLIYDSMDK